MAEIPLAQPVAAPQAPIAEDMPCMICGYNLRGLMIDGRCPECGSAVNRSVHGNLLRYADAEWLAKLLLGVRLMLWSILIGLLIGISSGIAGVLGVPMAILAGLAIIMAGLEVLTALLITTQEPRIALSERALTLRRVVRTCAALAFLGQVLQQIGSALQVVQWLAIVGMALGYVGVVASIGKLIYLRRFALRIPDPRLARSTKIVMWAFGIFMVGGAAIGVLAMVFVMGSAATPLMPAGPTTTTAPAMGTLGFRYAPLSSSFSSSFTVTSGPTATGPAAAALPAAAPPGGAAVAGMFGFAAVACIGGIVAVVFAIWYLVLLVKYRNAFREALAHARSFAAAGAGPTPAA